MTTFYNPIQQLQSNSPNKSKDRPATYNDLVKMQQAVQQMITRIQKVPVPTPAPFNDQELKAEISVIKNFLIIMHKELNLKCEIPKEFNTWEDTSE